MTHLLAAGRLGLLALLHAAVAGWGLVVMAVGRAHPPTGRRGQNGLLHFWCRGVLAILGMRVEVEGPVPAPPFFLVSNHLGYVDVLVLGTRLEASFVSKAEVRDWPVLGFLARVGRTVFVDRDSASDVARALRAIESLLRSGQGVVCFPEGTSTPGESVLPFKSPLFEAAVRTGTPVRCASLSYHVPSGSPPAHRAICWWGDMTFPDHFYRLLRVPRSEARVVFGETLEATDRRDLAHRAHQTILSQFTPTAEVPV